MVVTFLFVYVYVEYSIDVYVNMTPKYFLRTIIMFSLFHDEPDVCRGCTTGIHTQFKRQHLYETVYKDDSTLPSVLRHTTKLSALRITPSSDAEDLSACKINISVNVAILEVDSEQLARSRSKEKDPKIRKGFESPSLILTAKPCVKICFLRVNWMEKRTRPLILVYLLHRSLLPVILHFMAY